MNRIKRFLRRLLLMKVEFALEVGPGAKIHTGYLLGYTSVVTKYNVKDGAANLDEITWIAVIEPEFPINGKGTGHSNVMVETRLMKIL